MFYRMPDELHHVVVGSMLSGVICHFTLKRDIMSDVTRKIYQSTNVCVIMLIFSVFAINALCKSLVQKHWEQQLQKVEHVILRAAVIEVKQIV